MKRIFVGIAAAAVLLVVVFILKVPQTVPASSINPEMQEPAAGVDIDALAEGVTHHGEGDSPVAALRSSLKGEYPVRKVSKARERELMVETKPKYTVAFYTEEGTVLEIVFVTAFDTLVIAEKTSMEGAGRTTLYESVEAQPERIRGLEAYIHEL